MGKTVKKPESKTVKEVIVSGDVKMKKIQGYAKMSEQDGWL